MTSINRQLWQWTFNHHSSDVPPPAFNPIKADAVLRQPSDLLLTGIRRRGLFLRKTKGATGRALSAVMELSVERTTAIPKRPARNDATQGIVGGMPHDIGRHMGRRV